MCTNILCDKTLMCYSRKECCFAKKIEFIFSYDVWYASQFSSLSITPKIAIIRENKVIYNILICLCEDKKKKTRFMANKNDSFIHSSYPI